MLRSVTECRLIDLPRISDPRGSLGFVENGAQLPFDIRRLYYLYDVPDGQSRGAHAHLALEQLFIAISGSLEVVLDDGRATRSIRLERPDQGLYACPMMWRDIRNFSPGAVLLVLASQIYDPADYIHDYNEFKRLTA